MHRDPSEYGKLFWTLVFLYLNNGYEAVALQNTLKAITGDVLLDLLVHGVEQCKSAANDRRMDKAALYRYGKEGFTRRRGNESSGVRTSYI